MLWCVVSVEIILTTSRHNGTRETFHETTSDHRRTKRRYQKILKLYAETIYSKTQQSYTGLVRFGLPKSSLKAAIDSASVLSIWAQWIRLRLPTWGRGFETQGQHTFSSKNNVICWTSNSAKQGSLYFGWHSYLGIWLLVSVSFKLLGHWCFGI